MKNIKHLLLLCSLVLLVQCVKAQNPSHGILYTDLDPDIKLIENYQDTLGLDLNQDGASDVLLYFKHFGSIASRFGAYKTSNCNWEIAYCEGVDSLSVPHPNIPTFGWSSIEGLMDPESTGFRYGVRFHDGSAYYYGWLKVICRYNQTTALNEITIDKIAFCTIPNYPLVWGQTILNTDIEESEFSSMVFVHPNPTMGLVTVTGKSLRQVEVANVMGQHLLTATSEGDELTINISNLPAGIYFVNITDGEGRKCVRKLVKE